MTSSNQRYLYGSTNRASSWIKQISFVLIGSLFKQKLVCKSQMCFPKHKLIPIMVGNDLRREKSLDANSFWIQVSKWDYVMQGLIWYYVYFSVLCRQELDILRCEHQEVKISWLRTIQSIWYRRHFQRSTFNPQHYITQYLLKLPQADHLLSISVY